MQCRVKAKVISVGWHAAEPKVTRWKIELEENEMRKYSFLIQRDKERDKGRRNSEMENENGVRCHCHCPCLNVATGKMVS